MSRLQLSTNPFRNIERIVVELSPYMREDEVDKCLDFISTISTSKFDINPSVEDSVGQIKLMLGTERYWDLIHTWNDANQKLLKDQGNVKYRHKQSKVYYDGLDPEDDVNDYEIVYV
jgi:hypothetical protein